MEYINLEFFFNLEREGKKSVIDFCIKMGFIASSYECPVCKKPMKLADMQDRKADGYAWVCRHKNAIVRSIRKGTWFECSRSSLILLLKLAYLWVQRSAYAFICHELKITQSTIVTWTAFFRKVCVNAIKKEGVFIGGQNETVEIDAKSFSNIRNKKGCETWVFGGVERSTKNCFFEIIQNGEEGEIVGILKKYVRPGTTIVSDNWKGYDCLKSNGYKHEKVYGIKNSATGTHKNNILSLWGRLKKIISHNIADDQFEAYLAEIMWRRLHKGDTQRLLMAYFKIISHIFTPPIRDDPECIVRKTEIKDSTVSEIQLKEVNKDNYEKETLLEEVHEDNNVKETQLEEVNRNNSIEQKETSFEAQIWGNEYAAEVEVPMLLFEDGQSSEEDSEGEYESQNKRQKTTESCST